MRRAIPAIGFVLIVLVVLVTILQETHVIGGTSAPQTADVTQIQTQQLPETSAQQVDPTFCNTHQSFAIADTQAPFTDTAHGLFMTLPYTSAWTDADGGKLPPYLQLQDGIAFGPVVYGSTDQGKTCTATRAYTLTFGPPRPASLTQKTMEATYGQTGHPVAITAIGDLSAVTWTMDASVCSVPMLEVSGSTSNYILGMSCAALDGSYAHSLQSLEQIAASMKAQ
ncbi:MAG TPA: hypothetical protein VHA78_04585 [Candidatus Peribacteraceae bacterium]|nr:hypothetical protein [Candidatus Peribacteraceae bacterium]